MPTETLPRFDECIELYLTVYDRYGTDEYTADQVRTAFEFADPEQLLNLTVAYGLFEYNGSVYRVRCDPGEERWEAVLTDHATLVRRAISERLGTRDDSVEPEREGATLDFDGKQFTSVVVSDPDGFGTVTDAIAALPAGKRTCVVLRSPGSYANTVQRIADRLCDPTTIEESPVRRPFEKEGTDVVGAEKDELEFRLFLRSV